MVWFSCDACGDSIKKPKLNSHRCGGAAFTCVDCSTTFDRQGATGHTSCVTEHEKYALGATKPGGFAARGYAGGGGGGAGERAAAAAAAAAAVGLEFLSERPPWRCAACGVACTSRETLLGHAQGAKHRRRARAAAAAAAAAGGGGGKSEEQQQAPATPAPASRDEAKEAEAPGASDAAVGKEGGAGGDGGGDEAAAPKQGRDEKQAKKRERGGEEALVDGALLASVLKDARKRLASKGRLGLDRLRALVAKRQKKQGAADGGGGAGAGADGGGEDGAAVAAVVEAAVAELRRSASARMSKDGEKLKVVR